jgi:hypothetical protein
MLCGSRLILTSGLFITFLGGLSQVMPGSMEVLGLDWHQIVEAYQTHRDGQLKFQELQELDVLVLQNLKKKEALTLEVLQGKAEVLEAARRFREVDQSIGLLANLSGAKNDEFYCRQVITWAKETIKRYPKRWDKGILHQLEHQVQVIGLPVSTGKAYSAPVPVL